MARSGTGQYREVWKHRDFRLLTWAFLVDEIGSWAYNVVLIVWVFDKTGSPTWVAATTAASWAPRMLFSPYAGVLADRYERTRVMLGSSLLSAAAMVGVTVVIATDAPVVLALVFSGITTAFVTGYRPAAGGVLPDVVGERGLVAANAVFGGLDSLAVVVGPGIGGLILLADSPTIGVAVNAASFLGAALLVTRMTVRSRGDAGAAGEGLVRQVIDGLKALVQRRVALVLVLFCALDSMVYAASTVINVPLSEHLGTGSEGYSYLIAGFALGGVLAAGLANRVSASHRLAPVILLGMFALALPFAALAAVGSPVLAFGLVAVSGLGMVIVDVLALTALQREVPREVLGRVLGVFEALIPGSLLVASFVTAVLLNAWGLTAALVAIGVGFSAAAVLGIGPVVRTDRASLATVRALAPRVTLLESLGLFTGAARPMLERLAAAAVESTVPADTMVVREGEPADALWVLTEGEVSVSARGEGWVEQRLRTMQAPTFFGEIGILRGVPRTATVRATTPCVLLRIDAEDFSGAVQSSGVSSSVLAQSTARLARTHPRLAASGEVTLPAQRSDESAVEQRSEV
jgi:CRP-like cAMP-binding protein/predicted MFS family arabinose efflux permease